MKPVQLYGVVAALLLVAAAMALAAFLGKHKRNNDIERYRNLRELVIERSAELSRRWLRQDCGRGLSTNRRRSGRLFLLACAQSANAKSIAPTRVVSALE